MKILIVEDETAAYENLVNILAEIDPSIEIAGYTESISQTINWIQGNDNPDLILMDIQLSDGSAFAIFNKITIETPIVFTTAFDEYAIKAFRVNCIDYLLKPIKVEELRRAIEKFKRWTQKDIIRYISQFSKLAIAPRYKDKILVPLKDKLLPVSLSEVSFFYTTEKSTRIFMRDGKVVPYSKTLEQIEETLDPAEFIRANKQFILSRNSVKSITIWFDSRLMITMETEAPERIYISKNKAAEFKSWYVRESL